MRYSLCVHVKFVKLKIHRELVSGTGIQRGRTDVIDSMHVSNQRKLSLLMKK